MREFEVEAVADGRTVDAATVRTGLRTIELVKENDGDSETSYFKVSGIPVFMKGANWIPVDSFLPRPGADD
jgi:beta-mannosidase